MANIGRLMGSIGMDVSNLRKATDESIGHFKQLEFHMKQALKTADKISTLPFAPQKLKTTVEEARSQIENLRHGLKELRGDWKQLEKLGIDTKKLKGDVDNATEEIDRLEDSLTDLSKVQTVPDIKVIEEAVGKVTPTITTLKDDMRTAWETMRSTFAQGIDTSAITQNLDIVSKNIKELKTNLGELSTIQTTKDVSLLKPTIKADIERVSEIQIRIRQLKGELKTAEKLGIDVSDAEKKINTLSIFANNLLRDLSAVSKVRVDADVKNLQKKFQSANESVDMMKSTIGGIRTEIIKMGSVKIDTKDFSVGFRSLHKNIKEMQTTLENIPKMDDTEFGKSLEILKGRIKEAQNTISALQSKAKEKSVLGIDTQEIQRKLEDASQRLRLFEQHLKELRKVRVDTDMSGLKQGIEDVTGKITEMKTRIFGLTKEGQKITLWRQKVVEMKDRFKRFSDTLAVVAAKFLLIQFAIKRMSAVFMSIWRPMYNSVEDFRMSVLQITSMITSMRAPSPKNLSQVYLDSKQYAEGLITALEEIDRITIASAVDLRNMTEEFVKQGVLLDYMDKTARRAYANIANAVATIAAGFPAREAQIRQEARALLEGRVDPRSQLASQLDAMLGGKLKENLKLWREQGTVIKEVGNLLQGYAAAVDDLTKMWAAIGTTMDTIKNRIFRIGFKQIYEDINSLAIRINNSLERQGIIISRTIHGGWIATKATIEAIWVALQPFGEYIKSLGQIFGFFLKEFAVLAYSTLPVIARKIAAIITLGKEMVNTVLKPMRLISAVIVDTLSFDFKYTQTREGLKDIQETGENISKSFKELDKLITPEVKQRIDDFNRQIALIGVNFNAVQSYIKGMSIEAGKFRNELEQIGEASDEVKSVITEFQKRMDAIANKEIEFETAVEMRQEIEKLQSDLVRDLRETFEGTEIPVELDMRIEGLAGSLHVLDQKLKNATSLPEMRLAVGLDTGEIEKRLKSFYDSTSTLTRNWVDFQIEQITREKEEWIEAVGARANESKRMLEVSYEQEKIDRKKYHEEIKKIERKSAENILEIEKEFSLRRRKVLFEYFDSLNEGRRRLEELEDEITSKIQDTLESRLLEVKKFRQDYEKIYKELYASGLISYENYLDAINALDEASVERKKQITEKWNEEESNRTNALKQNIINYKLALIELAEAQRTITKRQAIRERIELNQELAKSQEAVLNTLDPTTAAYWQLAASIANVRKELVSLHELWQEQIGTLEEGMIKGFKKFVDEAPTIFQAGAKIAETAAQSTTNTLAGIFTDFRKGELKAWYEYVAQWSDMILNAIAQVLTQMLIAKAIGSLLGISISPLPSMGTPGFQTLHDGGIAGRDGKKEMFSRLKPNEIFAKLEKNEIVVPNNPTPSRRNEIMSILENRGFFDGGDNISGIQRTAREGFGGTEKTERNENVVVNNWNISAMDAKSLREYVRQNSDIFADAYGKAMKNNHPIRRG